MNELRKILGRVPVVPVLTVDRVEQAAPLARALVDGGLDVLELTLRTSAAMPALTAMLEAVPEAIVGVGTVLEPAQIERAACAGARFAASPGYDDHLARAAMDCGLPLLPGVMTPGEAMHAHAQGFDTLKFFPAAAAGGPGWLRALAAPLPQIAFCPTGGITPASCADYLCLPNVVCIGGSWLTPRHLLEAADWSAIRSLAQDAVRICAAARATAR